MMTFLLVLFLWVFSVCLHEFAHAAVAYRGGDISVKEKGYLSLNPLKYLHPVNSILMPVVFLLIGGIGLPGAAVYIERHRLKNRQWESAVSLAGPAANLGLLLVIGLLFQVSAVADHPVAPALAFLGVLQASAVVLNMLPLPGLDGYGALSPWLAPDLRQRLDGMAGWAFIALLILMIAVPAFGQAFWSVVALLAKIVGVPLWLSAEGYRQFKFW